jgi:hypothetical protein
LLGLRSGEYACAPAEARFLRAASRKNRHPWPLPAHAGDNKPLGLRSGEYASAPAEARFLRAASRKNRHPWPLPAHAGDTRACSSFGQEIPGVCRDFHDSDYAGWWSSRAGRHAIVILRVLGR